MFKWFCTIFSLGAPEYLGPTIWSLRWLPLGRSTKNSIPRRATSLIRRVVLLIGWKFASTNQKHYPDLGSDTSSVWNFCARFPDFISQGNKWWRHEMSAAFKLKSMFIQSVLGVNKKYYGQRQNTVKFRKLAPPCVSPSKYRPPKPETQKTLR